MPQSTQPRKWFIAGLAMILTLTSTLVYAASPSAPAQPRYPAAMSRVGLDLGHLAKMPRKNAARAFLAAHKPVVRVLAAHVAAPARSVPSGSIWDAIAACESGGNWADTEGTFEGGLQFLHSTWLAAGGGRYADHAYQATREQQITIAQSWLAKTSWAQWPFCSHHLGLR